MNVLPYLVSQISPLALSRFCETQEHRSQIARYWMRWQRRVRRFGQISPRHADLVTTFPAAVIATLSRQPNDPVRREINRLVIEGAPLSEIAQLLGLPLWFRRLPPEAFSQPIDMPVSAIAHCGALGARLLNTVPEAKTGRPDRWLQAVGDALATGDEQLAVWLGGQRAFATRRCPVIPILPLALYLSFSRRPELAASRLIVRPWECKMSLGRAANIARQWLIRLLQDKCVDLSKQPSDFSRTHVVGDFEIVPLLTASALVEEGIAMMHCVGTYVNHVAHGECRIYSLRRQGQRVATMEVRIGVSSGLPRVTQLKGLQNAAQPREVWEIATAWIMQRLRNSDSAAAFRAGPHSEAAFRKLVWEPYAEGAAMQPGDLAMPGIPDLLASLKALMPLERY